MTETTRTTTTRETAADGVHTGVERILRDRLGILAPSPEADLLESGLMDSLSLVELLLALERDFSVVISWDALEIDEFRSVSAIADFVERNRSG